jgi:lysozyme
MKINQKGIDLLKQCEGCKLKAYPDPATGAEPYTIGYGHTGNVKILDQITQEQANNFLAQDLIKFENGVSKLVKVTLNENQFSALVVFSYNLGLGNLEQSTLLKKINSNDFKGASEEFIKWNKANGKVMTGLTNRRQLESNLFQSL